MASNLPPGCTTADIDRHFGAPDTREVRGEIIVDVEVGPDYEGDFADAVEINKTGALEAEVVHERLNEESEHGKLATVFVGVSIDTQFRDESEIVSELFNSITARSQNAEVQIIDAEML